MNAENIHKNR